MMEQSSFARAAFGASKVYTATRLDETLPDGWPVRVLAGLEALAQLENGTLVVQADSVEIRGVTGSQNGRARITQILSDKLGQGKPFKVSVTYDKTLDPIAALPSPQECSNDLNATLAKKKITFAPGSAEIDASANDTIEALAKILARCPVLKMEIGGHTDAQGSTDGNRALSQARAEAVLLALQGRRAAVEDMVAVGYGEGSPLGDNGTEDGRETNRRIEFTLLEGAKPNVTLEDMIHPAAQGDAPNNADGTPDFSGDTSPSVAPAKVTTRPKPRPKQP